MHLPVSRPAALRKFGTALLLTAVLGLSTRPGIAAPPSACPGDHGTPTYSFAGSFGTDLEGSYVLVPFEVPGGITRVRVKLCHDQPGLPTSQTLRHTLDLGVYETRGPDGFFDVEEFRGWGGSSRLNVLITPTDATTVGFKPGSIRPGEWAAEIGVASVAGPDEGDLDGRVEWRLEVFLGTDPADRGAPWRPTKYDDAPADPDAGWYSGDFHVHAEHSSPNDASMQETFDYAFGPRPEGAGLDFITLSDYITDRHWDEIGKFQDQYPGKLIIRSAEIITYRGHVNNHASLRFVDYRTGPIYELQGETLLQVHDQGPASRLFDDIHASPTGWTQVNHPTIFPATVPGFGSLCRGCSWEYSDQETEWSKVDAFEVQTGPSGTPDPEGNELGPNPFTPSAIEWWDRLRRTGYDITAVGSSDSHHAGRSGGTAGVTQSPIGEATTVVFARELSEGGIREGILAGHAYVKFFSSDGPDLRLTARPSGGGPEVMMGDTLAAPSAEFLARVLGGAPSLQPRMLVVIRDGVPLFAAPVLEPELEFRFTAILPGDYRLQLQRGAGIEALTNPITLES